MDGVVRGKYIPRLLSGGFGAAKGRVRGSQINLEMAWALGSGGVLRFGMHAN